MQGGHLGKTDRVENCQSYSNIMIWSCYWLIIRNKNWNPALAILYWIWKLCIFCVCIPFHVTNLYQKLRRKHFQKIIMIFLQIKYHMQRVDEKLEIQRRGFVSRDLLAELSGSQNRNQLLIFHKLAAFTSKHLLFQLLFVLANFKLFSVWNKKESLFLFPIPQRNELL